MKQKWSLRQGAIALILCAMFGCIVLTPRQGAEASFHAHQTASFVATEGSAGADAPLAEEGTDAEPSIAPDGETAESEDGLQLKQTENGENTSTPVAVESLTPIESPEGVKPIRTRPAEREATWVIPTALVLCFGLGLLMLWDWRRRKG